MLAQQAERERDLVAEVHDAMPLLDPRVRLVGRGELLMHRGLVGLDVRVDRLSDRRAERACVSDVCLRRNVFVARATEELEEGAHVGQRIPRWPVALERHRDLALLTAVQMLTHEDHLLRRREDAKLAGPAKLESELAEDLVAEAMECADDGVVQADRRVDIDALLHLVGGALGECDGQDLVRLRGARRDEVDDPRGQDMGLPRSGASDDKKRPGPVLHRSALLKRERSEDVRPLFSEPEGELLGHR